MPVWPPQDTGLFDYKTPCCLCPVTYLLPFCIVVDTAYDEFPIESYGTDPTYGFPEFRFIDLTTAEGYRSSYTTTDCLSAIAHLSFDNPGGTWAITDSFVTGSLTIGTVLTMPLAGPFDGILCDIIAVVYLKAGDTVTIDFDMEADASLGVLADMATCGNTFESSSDEGIGPGTGTMTFPDVIPVDGLYFVEIIQDTSGKTSVACSFVVNSTSGIVSVDKPMILYNDGSGGTAMLSCP